MLVSHAWLRDWVTTRHAISEIGECLTLGGLEVASVHPASPNLPKKYVVVGRVVQSEPHPNAHLLKVCQVEVGKRSMLTIVCGAANVAVGKKVPVAMVGAKLPTLEIQARMIKGIESAGMICSTFELGLEEASDGIMLLHSDAPVGMSINEYLDLSDSVFDIELSPNRGDCLSTLGIAREISALSGAELRTNKISKTRAVNNVHLPITLDAPNLCPRYVGRALCNVDMSTDTPDWMKERLRRSGLRYVNLVVDVTNYVMLEIGQPLHAFDMERLAGGIIVRMAKPNEKLQLLDGNTVKLNRGHLVIADHKKVVALAGIMGGQNSAISSSTRHVYLEAAFFPAVAVLGKAREFGLHTDASHRFERGADPALQADAIERATELLVALAGGEAGPVSDVQNQKWMPKVAKIHLKNTEVGRILGHSVPAETITAILEKLGMKIAADNAGWSVTVPSWRSDITGAHDLVEEVGRVYGLDKIPPHLPTAAASTRKHPENHIAVITLKQKLVERDYFEAITYSFVDPKLQARLLGEKHNAINLNNPIADNMSIMRGSLWTGLLEAVRFNSNYQHKRVRLFEFGNVFFQHGCGHKYQEVSRLAGAITGTVLPRQWGTSPREVDFFDIKDDLLVLTGHIVADISFAPTEHPALHPGRSAVIRLSGNDVGYIGQLHPSHQQWLGIDQSVYLFEINVAVLETMSLPKFTMVSKYPAVHRDLAIMVNLTVTVERVLEVMRAASDNLLVELELFDIYIGDQVDKNKKSFAFHLTFQSQSGNLTADNIDQRIERIMGALRQELNAQLRK